MALYQEDDKTFHKAIRNAMKQDFSWDASAKEYVKLYQRLCPEAE